MNEFILNHPLITHKFSILRDKNTGNKEFRELISEITAILVYEAMRDAELEDVTIETPLEKMQTGRLNADRYVFVPIIRAGLGMADGVLKIIPNAKFGFIGLKRNEETFMPVEYYYNVPEGIDEKEVIIIDPMLATGGSASAAISRFKQEGVSKIKFLCIVAAPQGIKTLEDEHPDVEIFCAAVDREMDENAYIRPGLGDAGDRICGTD